MATISFNEGKLNEWESDKVAESIRVIVSRIAVKFGGVYVTSLIRNKIKNLKAEGVDKSRHIPENNESGLCSACDFVLQVESIPDLVTEVIGYVNQTFSQVYIVFHKTQNGKWHFHLQVMPVKALPVEIKF